MNGLKILLKIGGWFVLVNSIVWLGVGVFSYVHARNFVKTALGAQGVVVRFDNRRDHDSKGAIYYPVIVYQDANSESHELSLTVGSSRPSYKVGDKVDVLYAPKDPRNAKIDGFFYVWQWALIGGGVGTFDVILGLAMLFTPTMIEKFRRVPPVIKAG